MIAATTFGLTSCSDSNGGDSPSGGDGEGQTAYLAVNLNPVGTAAGVASSKPFLRDATHNYPDGTEYDGTDGKADKEYQDGTEDEGKIYSVRFYFFDAGGNAYNLTKAKGTNDDGSTFQTINNYLDIDDKWPVTQTDDDLTTIEARTSGVLVINGVKANEMPAKILALVNLTDAAKTALGTNPISETDLLDKTHEISGVKANIINKYTKDGVSSKTNFIMSSTAYLNNDVKVVSSTITSANYATTADAARKAVPVQLYVERLAARVNVNAGTTGWTSVGADEIADGSDITANMKKYALADNYSLSYVGGGSVATPIYVVVKGWGLADENNNAPIIKSLDESYTTLDDVSANNINTLANQPLSVSDYHRSFWETANDYSPIRYTFTQYVSGNATDADRVNDACGKSLGEGAANAAYTFPNTPKSTSGWSFTWNETNLRTEVTDATAQVPTKVVVAAELMYKDSDGKLQTAVIGTYHGQNYLGEDNVKKAIVADMMASADAKLCVKDETNSTATKTVYKAIDYNNIDFKATSEVAGNEKSYMLTPVIKMNGTALPEEYYTYNTTTGAYTQVTTETDVNNKLSSVAGENITIYKDGNTYYYTTLQHLWFPSNFALANASTAPTNAGAWGVVRNHLYKVTLNSIAGWGTPVYFPNYEIIPITPKEQQSYLGAQINVLMWRVVNQSVDINGEPLTN